MKTRLILVGTMLLSLVGCSSSPLEESAENFSADLSISRTLRNNQHLLQACYRNGLKALKLESLPPAFVRYEITVGGLGGVIDVTLLETTLNRPEIENCIAKELSNYRFEGVKQTILTETFDTKQLE